METMLIFVTLVSVLIAIAACVVAWRSAMAERRRSDARVAALATDIGTPMAASSEAPLADARFDSLIVEPAAHLSAASRVLLDESPRDVFDDAGTTAPARMFASTASQEGSRFGRAIPAFATGFLLVVAVVGAIVLVQGATSGSEGASQSAASAAAAHPLELLSLHHATEDGSISVTGLVRNPVEAVAARRLTAVVLFFGQDGAFLGSGRAPLDFTTLAPGDESPFVVKAPAPARVNRYRVSFRAEDERPLPHVDRRPRS